ncbi:hypothetical protein ACJMK2_033412 [Sinanodonta woodiana]|uniref:HECT-type E3 ubiquitin transferase n=1 Tax=Sinanodonta woodiana TaxID=1069815 RepID=A0ABD3WNA1_SINWO
MMEQHQLIFQLTLQQQSQQQQQEKQHGLYQMQLPLVLPSQKQTVPMVCDNGSSVGSLRNAISPPNLYLYEDPMLTSSDYGTELSMDFHVEPYSLQEELFVPDASDVFSVDEFLFSQANDEEISATDHTEQENRHGNSQNVTNMQSTIENVPQERRIENLHRITEFVLSEESRNSRYSGYSMLLEFIQNIECIINSAVNGESEYPPYITETVDVVQRTLEEWKRENPDKEFNIGRDLFGMNMQDFINKAIPRCVSVLSNPIPTSGISNPSISPVISNPITQQSLSNPTTTPVLSSSIHGLSSEVSVAVNQSSPSTADNSNETQRNSHRVEPYPRTSLTYSRNVRQSRSRQHSRTYMVCYYSKNILPLRVNRSRRTNLILETDIQIFSDDDEDDIREKLLYMLVVKHGYHHINEDDFVFLKYARGKLDLPIYPQGFEWNGDSLRRLIGNGKLHVMVRVNQERHSSFSASCVFSECERNYARTSSTEIMDEEGVDEAIGRIGRNVNIQSQSAGPNTVVSPQESKDKIAGALREHAEKVVKGFKRNIKVKRDDIWNSALEFFKIPDFIREFGKLSVKFQRQDGITEEASDFSGPKREFFRLLIRDICKRSGAFMVTPNGLVPRTNIRQLQEGVLRHIGRMISTIVIQGGEAPAMFSPIITQCILKDPISTKPEVDDVPDLTIRESLHKVQEANDMESLDKALSSCDWRLHVDGLPSFVNIENKENFVLSSSLYFAVLQRQIGIEQLLEGLEYYDFLALLRSKPFICDILEYKKDDISAKDMGSLMKPEYSCMVSKREKEEILFSNLKDFLHLVEDKTLLQWLDDDFIILTSEERDFIATMKPSKLLEFCTGSSKIPALGFEEDPHITFSHNDMKFHPTAHTCGNKLVLYLNDKTVNDKSSFFKIMVETLMNADHFGFS